VVGVEHDDRANDTGAGKPRRIPVQGTEGITADVVLKTYRRKVWMSLPPSTWGAIMDSAQVDELVNVLRLAREDAARDGGGRR